MVLIPTLTLWQVARKGASPEELEKGMNTVVLPELRAYSEAESRSAQMWAILNSSNIPRNSFGCSTQA